MRSLVYGVHMSAHCGGGSAASVMAARRVELATRAVIADARMSSLSTPAPPLDALGARHQQFLKAARVPLLDAEAAIGRRLSVEQIEDLARKKRRVQTLTVLLSLMLLMFIILFTLIFLPQRLGLLSKHDEAHENLLGQGQLFFLLLGAFGAGALLTHMISRLLAARIHATVAAAARAEAESLASGGAVVMN